MLETKDIIIILGVCIGLLMFAMYFQTDHYAVKIHEGPMEKESVELETMGHADEEPVSEEVSGAEAEGSAAEEEEAVAEEAASVDGKKITIALERNFFSPNNITVDPMTEVIFKNVDDRRHRIKCYYEKQIIYYSDLLDSGDYFAYVFEKVGKYRCNDVFFIKNSYYWLDIEVIGESEKVVELGAGSAFISFIKHNFIQSLMLIVIIAIFSAHYYELSVPKRVLTRKKK